MLQSGMEIIEYMSNLPRNNAKIIPKIFSPLNVEVFGSKINGSKERVQGYFIFNEEMSINGFIYHLAGGKLGKLQGADKLDLVESFYEQFRQFQKAYNSIYNEVKELNQQKYSKIQKEFANRYLFRKGITFVNYIQKGKQKFEDGGQKIAIALIKLQSKWVLAVLKRSQPLIQKKSFPVDPIQQKEETGDWSRSIILFIFFLIVLGFIANVIQSSLGVTQYINGPLYYCSRILDLFK